MAVVYLDRWGNPPHFPKAFLDSLLRFPAGAEFDLIWQMKGYPDGASCGALAAFRQSFGGAIHEMRYPDDLYQFSLALDAARKHDYEFFLFFISWSRILARNWLKFYLDAFANHPDCGIVGATGNYEGLPPDQPFPNPHIRTNAFMVRRELYLSLDFGSLTSKASGNQIEAGPNGITRQIVLRGLAPLVVDRYGRTFASPDWPRSHTFRSGSQEALLVADNHTHNYAKRFRREKPTYSSWGKGFPITRLSPLGQIAAEIRWKYPVLARWLRL